MPIEIKEVHIRIRVNDEKPRENVPEADRENLIAECVEQVLHLLKTKDER